MTKFISAALAAALLAGTASAQTSTRTVSYADLDLASAAGAKALQTRVRSAAKSVCDVSAARDLASVAASNRCFDSAVEKAQTEMQQAITQARTGA